MLWDLHLVNHIGATTDNDRLEISYSSQAGISAYEKLFKSGIDIKAPFIIIHPGVSELKRRYPLTYWIETGKLLRREFNTQILITGSASESVLAEKIKSEIGINCYNISGADY